MMNEEIKVPQGGNLQRDKEYYMLRARLFLGRLSLDALKTLIEVGKPYYDRVRFTYRQNIQLYQFPASVLEETIARLEAHGMACKGRLGDIVVNALSGEMEEAFDVLPYAEKLWQWLNDSGRLAELPGKFKMVFSSTEKDEGNASFADLGFYAKMVDGKPCFDVYAAGSLGAMPMLGVKIEENLPAEDFLCAADKLTQFYIDLFADVKVFKKRLRFKLRELGEATFKSRYQTYHSNVPSCSIEVKVKENTFAPEVEGLISLRNHTYGVCLKPSDGEFSFKGLETLANFLETYAKEARLIVGSRHELYVLDLPRETALDLLAKKYEILTLEDNKRQALQSCVGASLCTYGFTNTKALLASLEGLEDLPKLAISGCMNACPQHQIAEFGLFGRKPNPEDFGEELYEIFVGGHLKDETREGKLAESKAKILAKNVVPFIKLMQEEKGNLSWAAYLEQWEKIPTTYFEN